MVPSPDSARGAPYPVNQPLTHDPLAMRMEEGVEDVTKRATSTKVAPPIVAKTSHIIQTL
jgi:hypothetical protein